MAKSAKRVSDDWNSLEERRPRPFELLKILHKDGKVSSGWLVGGKDERAQFDGALKSKAKPIAWRYLVNISYTKGERFEKTRYV